MPKFTGVCRIRGEAGQPNMVRVTDGDLTFDDVDEKGYHMSLIQPPLDELPWCAPKSKRASPEAGEAGN